MKQVYLNINNDLLNDIFNLDDEDEYMIDETILEMIDSSNNVKSKKKKEEKEKKPKKESKSSKKKEKEDKKKIKIKIKRVKR